MLIRLTKISDQQHGVELVRNDGSRECIDLVTREALVHDFIHYSVEASIPTQGGFWGVLASGKSFAEMNDRSGESTREFAETLMMVEGMVGMMTGVIKGDLNPAQAIGAIRDYYAGIGQSAPEFLSERFVTDVRENMRKLQGHWKATPYGETMEVVWDETAAASRAAS